MKLAYEAADLSGYLLAGEIEKLAGNPYQANGMEGITVINPTGVTQKIALDIPVSWTKEERQLSGVRAKRYIPYIRTMEEKPYYADEKRMFAGYAEVPPFSYQVIPFEKLEQYRLPEETEKITCQDGVLETPYYRVAYNECTGRILQIHSKTQDKDLIDETSPWGFFEVVRETIDPRSTRRRDVPFSRGMWNWRTAISAYGTMNGRADMKVPMKFWAFAAREGRKGGTGDSEQNPGNQVGGAEDHLLPGSGRDRPGFQTAQAPCGKTGIPVSGFPVEALSGLELYVQHSRPVCGSG